MSHWSRIIDVSLYIYNSLYIIYIPLLYTPLTVAKKANISTGHVKKYGVRKGRKERTKKKKSMQEIRKAVRLLKNGKSSGPDLFLNEFLKYGINSLLSYLHTLFNRVFDT